VNTSPDRDVTAGLQVSGATLAVVEQLLRIGGASLEEANDFGASPIGLVSAPLPSAGAPLRVTLERHSVTVVRLRLE
jgi:hypothetical protein